jgi:hypothetical protein
MSRTRAFRRYKLQLKKRKCSRYGVAGYWWIYPEQQTDKRIIGITATTPKACGCWMCGNPTKNHGENFATVKRKSATLVQE